VKGETEVARLLATQCKLGEGPLWDVATQTLYFVDIRGRCYYRWSAATGALTRVDVGVTVAALTLRAEGGLLLATNAGLQAWDEATGRLTPLVNPEPDRPFNRFNDAAVDRCGRWWASTYGDAPSVWGQRLGALYCLQADGHLRTIETAVGCANGIGWSPDDKTMYFTDSGVRTIYAYDFDLARGEAANRRVFVQPPPEFGTPDGLTVDAEGGVWSACWGGGQVVCYDPTGRPARILRIPAPNPTSVMFGGPQLDQLFVTSAWDGLTPAQRAAAPLAGDLFVAMPGVRGRPELRFG